MSNVAGSIKSLGVDRKKCIAVQEVLQCNNSTFFGKVNRNLSYMRKNDKCKVLGSEIIIIILMIWD